MIRWVWLLICAAPALAEEIPRDHLPSLSLADVVIVGEVHDNPAHHENQTTILFGVQPRVIVFEMLTPEQAARPYDRFDMKAMAATVGWKAAGWPDFTMYYPLFVIVPNARIVGAGMGDAAIQIAVVQGAGVAFGAHAARYGLDKPLAEADQAQREAEQYLAHCGALPKELLPGMVAAQRLRDAALARATVQAVEATGGPVVVIAGNGHARNDRGVPAVLRLVAPDLQVLSVGQLEARAEDAPFDLWVVSDAPERQDPCTAFR